MKRKNVKKVNILKISIVITTFNRKYALAELLESIHYQTVLPYEIIIVNDCGESIEDLAEIYSDLPITIYNLVENMKHVHARNTGIKRATGDAIMLCDDDDYLTKGHIERMANALHDADFVYSDAEIVDFMEKENIRFPISRRLFAYEFDLKGMREFSTYVPSGSLYRKEIHEEIGLFDPEVHNYWDWDFFLRVAEKFVIKRVPVASVIYAFSEAGNNQSAQLNTRREGFLKKLCKKHQLGILPAKNFFVLLEEPKMKLREAKSEIVWDGEPLFSKLMKVGERIEFSVTK